jgi:alanyl-tRNA synthetase
MRSQDIRQSFVDFFAERGHRPYPSAPLVPHGDPTLLFTNAGMVQFKDFFLGNQTPPATRAVTVQKCLRVSGKHNDLENVGPSPRHHTFFEMLGNFSFGDYFKEEAIEFGWDLVTRVWGIDPARLTVSVFEEDDEAAELWPRISGLAPQRVYRCGSKDNFWAMGETGPCGPCSEIFVDVHPELPPVDWHEGNESGRYLEIWNLVFMQFSRDENGTMVELPNPSIDTGAGLERVASVLQGVESNYDSDLFSGVIAAASELAGVRYGAAADSDTSMRVIADHLRAVSFLLADGVIPGNEGRGYVLRRILRRAVRHGMALGFEEPFLNRLVPVLGESMGDHYTELGETEAASVATVTSEEEKFLSTVALASRQVQQAIEAARAQGVAELSGETVFRFYDTNGLPLELIEEIAEEERFAVDREGFERELGAQRSRSRSSGSGSQRRAGKIAEAVAESGIEATPFVGYDQWSLEAVEVMALMAIDGDQVSVTEQLGGESEATEGYAVLSQTPFYAESGGQVGDQGRLEWDGGAAVVSDTGNTTSGVIVQRLRVESGTLTVGSTVRAAVDAARRSAIQRNHTATHLLHAALRRVLGEGARQAGSLVAPDRLRFDFTHGQPMTNEEVAEVERLVNLWVLEAQPTSIREGQSYQEAIAAGAMALFGEKYGDEVRTVQVPSLSLGGANDPLASLELCGGCHVANVGEIGPVVVTSERGVASGVRRLEALTGSGALSFLNHRRELIEDSARALGVEPEQAEAEIGKLSERVRHLESEMSSLRMKLLSGMPEDEGTQQVEGVEVMVREVPPAPAGDLRAMADVLRSRLESGVVVLGTREADKVTLIAAVTDDLSGRVHAGKLVQKVVEIVDGRGGGRADFAQAGGREPDKLPAALESVPAAVREQLS